MEVRGSGGEVRGSSQGRGVWVAGGTGGELMVESRRWESEEAGRKLSRSQEDGGELSRKFYGGRGIVWHCGTPWERSGWVWEQEQEEGVRVSGMGLEVYCRQGSGRNARGSVVIGCHGRRGRRAGCVLWWSVGHRLRFTGVQGWCFVLVSHSFAMLQQLTFDCSIGLPRS